MENQQKDYKSMTEVDKENYKNSLREAEEITRLQASIAENKAKIKKSNLEELLSSIKIFEITNPKEEQQT